MISISRKLLIQGNKVLLPGCEPESGITSTILALNRSCCSSHIDLDVALAAIPGSYIENKPYVKNQKDRWLVLPPIIQNCDCGEVIDYFRLLREAACNQDQSEYETNCGPKIDMGYCPPKEFDYYPIPPVSPYVDEGQYYHGINNINYGKYEPRLSDNDE